MSLRNRARRLQHATGSSYQQALARLRALGAEPAALSRSHRWPLGRCDLYLVDRALDDEWREVAARSSSVEEARCVCCAAIYFAGDAERRARVDECPRCRAVERRPIDVVELERARPTRAELLADLCAWLHATAGARAVLLVDERGLELAHSGSMLAANGVMLARSLMWSSRRSLLRELDAERVLDLDTGEGTSLLIAPVAKRALLLVLFDRATSLGLVRLRVRRAIELLERLLAADVTPWGGPGSSGSSSGGNPAELAIEVAALRRRQRS
ncbi:MAG TPA: hypothetical protein VFF06_33025 [Polyangia bacterium]|nr:hypothetical protein [Polyangia bacterium]